jgi:hypothetical protein
MESKSCTNNPGTGALVFPARLSYLSPVKSAILLALLIPFCHAHAQILSFDPERLVSLELINQEIVSGRIIDADAGHLHLVGARVNRLIPFNILTERSRKEIKLVSAPGQPGKSSSSGEFQGLNSTRTLLKDSQQALTSSRRVPFPAHNPYTVSYPFYHPSFFYRPSSIIRSSGFSAQIQINF